MCLSQKAFDAKRGLAISAFRKRPQLEKTDADHHVVFSNSRVFLKQDLDGDNIEEFVEFVFSKDEFLEARFYFRDADSWGHGHLTGHGVDGLKKAFIETVDADDIATGTQRFRPLLIGAFELFPAP